MHGKIQNKPFKYVKNHSKSKQKIKNLRNHVLKIFMRNLSINRQTCNWENY